MRRRLRIILVRHPKPLRVNGLCYGRLDVPCDPEALEIAATRLAKHAVDCLVISSPAIRALSLAERLSAAVSVEPRLQELDFGDWEGRLWQDLGRNAIETWRLGLPASAPPNGESLDAMSARLAGWLAGLSGQTDILAITHAGPIRVLRALVKGEPILTYFDRNVPFAEPVLLDIEEPFTRPE